MLLKKLFFPVIFLIGIFSGSAFAAEWPENICPDNQAIISTVWYSGTSEGSCTSPSECFESFIRTTKPSLAESACEALTATSTAVGGRCEYGSGWKNYSVSVAHTCGEPNACDKDGTEAPFYAEWNDIKNSAQACVNNCMVVPNGASIARYASAGLLETAGTILSKYTGGDCTSSESFAQASIPTNQDPIEIQNTFDPENPDAPQPTKLVYYDYASDTEFTVDDSLNSGDVEPTVDVPDGVADVVSSVANENDQETQSAVDNEQLPNWEQLNEQFDKIVKYQVTSTSPTGNQIKNDVIVYSNGNLTKNPDGTDKTPTGDQIPDGSINDPTNVDMSGVENKLDSLGTKLDELAEQGRSGSVTFSGSCDDPAPVCDTEKPFCQLLIADYDLKCSEYDANKAAIDEILEDDPFSGRGELTEEWDLLPMLQDITNIQKTGTCPADSSISINLGGTSKSITFDTQPYCDFATTIRPMILFIGIFMVFRIVARF